MPSRSTSTLPLAGCCVTFSGSFPGRTQASLLSWAASLGATTCKSLGGAVTHLVASQADFDNNSNKVYMAKQRYLFIVNLDWLIDSETNKAKEDEAKYSFLPISSAQSPPLITPPSAQPSPLKRQASGAPDNGAQEVKKSKLEESSRNASEIGKGQIAKGGAGAVQVPVDERCDLPGYYVVHIDDDGVIWDATLNQTSSSKNANKFYRLQVLEGQNNDHKLWARWGRIGEPGMSTALGDGTLKDAIKQFQKKFKDKSGLKWEDRAENPKPGKYVFIERNYEQESDDDSEDVADGQSGPDKSVARENSKPPPCTLMPQVKQLMELIFNQQHFAAAMSAMNYDNKKMPLGKLSKANILRGFQMLKDLTAVINGNAAADGLTVDQLSDLYYSLIPHDFGNRSVRPPILQSLDMIKNEVELLETLADMKEASNIMKTQIDGELNRVHPIDRQYNGLGMDEMTPLDPAGKEFQLLEKYLNATRGATHNRSYRVEGIFRIRRQGEEQRFGESLFSGPPKDRRLLWHGSRATNFGGILSQGLRIAPPEAPATGYMFGKGVYLADMSSKSANYCHASISDNTGLLLLCEAELGNPMLELTRADYNAPENAKAQSCWTTLGRGRTGPTMWKDATCVHPSLEHVRMPDPAQIPTNDDTINSSLLYNEYICYDVAQIRLRYLFRVKM